MHDDYVEDQRIVRLAAYVSLGLGIINIVVIMMLAMMVFKASAPIGG